MDAKALLVTGPQPSSDGNLTPQRAGKSGESVVTQLHGRYYEQAARRNIFCAANQAAQAWSVGLATTYTGLVVSNPFVSNQVNLSILQVGFALSVAPAAIASIGMFAGYAAAGGDAVSTHTTPLVPARTFIGGGVGQGLADSAATLVGGKISWVHQMMGGFTAAALPGTSPTVVDVGGLFIIPPGAFFAIGALTAVTGLASIIWEEIPV